MESYQTKNVVCVIADLSGVPKEYSRLSLDVLFKDSQRLIEESSKIKGLVSINRVLSEIMLERLIGEKSLLEQVRQFYNPGNMYIVSHWETSQDVRNFYQGDLHKLLSEHGIGLRDQGARLAVCSYLDEKLNNPVIIDNTQ